MDLRSTTTLKLREKSVKLCNLSKRACSAIFIVCSFQISAKAFAKSARSQSPIPRGLMSKRTCMLIKKTECLSAQRQVPSVFLFCFIGRKSVCVSSN